MPEVLEISDGTVTVSLIAATGTTGWHLRGARPGWNPETPRYKGGGTWQDSPLATGRYLADKKFTNIIDTFFLHLEASTQDGGIADIRELQQLLEKAAEYWATDWQDEPVWIKAQAENETNARYAIIYTGLIPDFNDPYSCRFEGGVAWPNDVWMWNLSLITEHGLWQATQPETGTAVAISALEAYDGRNLGNVDSTGARDPTTDEEVYVCPKRATANLTDIYTWSAANGWSGNLMVAALPYDLIDIAGAAPAVNDFVLFGIDTTVADSGPFASLVFDIGTAISGITLTWEYWNGAWVALTTQDNTNQNGGAGGSPLDTTGVGSVHWRVPADWATRADGPAGAITAYWVRARVTAAPGAHVAPTQQNRDVYSIIWAYVQIEQAQVGGDIPALARIRIRNQSDTDGSAAPALWANRVVMGLRTMARGTTFEAYLNFADEQNPGTISAGVRGAAAFGNNVQTSTGRYINLPAGAGDSCYIQFDSTDADLYRGRFHMYMRGQQQGAGTLQINASITAGVNRTYSTTSTSVADWQLLDFGTVIFPSEPIDASEDMSGFTINVDIDQVSGTPTLYLYDLILIPVDEWAADLVAVDPSDNDSILGYRGTPEGIYLSVDSIYRPKSIIRSILYTDFLIIGTINPLQGYQAITVPPAILQANQQQRLWFLAVKESGGTWYAYQELGFTIRVDKNQRYLTMRGAT